MANRLELPDELNSLIEKREGEDRRVADPSSAKNGHPVHGERRSGEDRRANSDSQES